MRAILVALLVALSLQAPARAVQCAPPATHGPLDYAIVHHQYAALERGVVADPKLQQSYFAAVLDNKRARYVRSQRELLQDLPALRAAAECARLGYAYVTLADDYKKQYRYAAAADALAQAMHYRQYLSADDAYEARSALISDRAMSFAPPQSVRVSGPFEVPRAAGKISVSVGRHVQPFIFDTGAGITTMSASAARRNGIPLTTHKFMTHGSTGVLVAGHLALADFTIAGKGGNARMHNALVLVLPDQALYIAPIKLQLEAILGYPVISALGKVDVGATSIRIEPSAAGSVPPNLFFDGSAPLVQASVDGEQGLMLFDTGADVTRLYASYYNLHRKALAPPKRPMYTAGVGGGMTRITTVARSANVTIAGQSAVLSDVPVFAKPLNRSDRYLLGQLALDYFKPFGGYTLDFSRATLTIADPGTVVQKP